MGRKKEQTPLEPEAQAAQNEAAASMAEAYADYDTYVQTRASEIWSYQDSGHEITLEEQLFVRSYIIDRNPVAAMRRLGHLTDDPTKLRARANKYLSKSEVKGAIDFYAAQLMDKLDITAEKVQAQIAAVAFFDPREVMTFDQYGVKLLHSRFWTKEQAASISSIKMGQTGLEIKMYDRLRATEMLAKQLGTLPEDMNPAEAAKAGSEAVMTKIGQIVDRLLPDRPVTPSPPPEGTPE